MGGDLFYCIVTIQIMTGLRVGFPKGYSCYGFVGEGSRVRSRLLEVSVSVFPRLLGFNGNVPVMGVGSKFS